MNSPSYVIITPARDEREHIQKTIDSVVSQTIRPRKWVIVNDGSRDDTGSIVDRAANLHPWISVVHRPDRGSRKAGGGVMETFYEGYRVLRSEMWDFLIKLDGDLSFDPDYFAKCFERFRAEPKLGIGGGTICIEKNGELIEESKGDPRFHVRGATKIYRRGCWEAIDGLLRETGWDTLDELKANMLGWQTRTFPDIKLQHWRESGGADGAWKNWFKNGRANYIVGYHPVFMLSKCAKRLFDRPYGLASVALFCGFISGYLNRAPRVSDAELIRYLRQQQIARLMLRPSLWGA
jgi:poly-beta-1,6-N-acetyl-D-glucosamine synthase